MKLGLLADIHEHTRQLQVAIDVLQQHGADCFVVLGDVFEMGKPIEQTVRLLHGVEAVGVWQTAAPWSACPAPPNLENPGQTENRPRISGKAVEVSDHRINLSLRCQP
jgi:hypothetical protein